MRALSFLLITFERDFSQVFEKNIPRMQTWQEVGTRLVFQRGREKIHSCKFSRVNAIRKGRCWVCCQEESCLKFSQAEGTLRLSWSGNMEIC